MGYPKILKNDCQIILAYSKNYVLHLEGNCKGEKTTGYNFNLTEEYGKKYLQNTWGVVESKKHAEFIIELASDFRDRTGFTEGYPCWFCFDEHELFFFDSKEDASAKGERKITIPLSPKAETTEEDLDSSKMDYPSEVTLEDRVYSHTGKGIFSYREGTTYSYVSYELLIHRGGFISNSEVSIKVGVGDDIVATHPNNVLKGKLVALTKQYAIISQGKEEQHLQLVNWKITKAKTPEEEVRDWVQERIGYGIASGFDCEQITHDLFHHLDILKRIN